MQLEKMKKEFSPRRVQELIYDISTFDRAKGSDDYHRAVEFVQQNVEGVERLTFTSDATYNSWEVPADYNLKDGYLRYAGEGDYLISSLASQPTAALFTSDDTGGEVKLKVFDAGKGEEPEDYEGYDGEKAVLAHGQPTAVYYQAVRKRGAECILLCHMRSEKPSIGRSREQMPGAVNYTSLPSVKSEDEHAYGFSLCWSQVKELRQKLEEEDGSLELEARIDLEPGTGELEILKAEAGRGQSERKPLLLTAHLCHPRPSANDNASGAALLVEIMRVLKQFEPRRKIVAIWVPEMYGPAALLEEQEGWDDFELALNLDMVGEDQDLTGSTLNVFSTAWSMPSFLSELAAFHLEDKSFRMNEEGYAGGSDHFIFSNPSVGVPAVSLTQLPDRYYHTDLDTPDKTSRQTLRWVGEAVLGIISDLEEMKTETLAGISARIVDNYLRETGDDHPPLVENYRAHLALTKLQQLAEYGEAVPALDWLGEEAGDFTPPQPREDFRSFTGPLSRDWMDIEERLEHLKLRRRYDDWGNFCFELLNFLELGYEREDAIELARAEFDLPEEIEEEARDLLEKLQREELIEL